jgi:L-fuconolactonase
VGSKQPRQVDTHVHVVSDDEVRYPLQPSDVTGPWYREHPCSIEALLEKMDDAEVDAALLVQAVSAYQFDNRYTLDSARRFPQRCSAVVCTDLSGEGPDANLRGDAADGARGVRWWGIGGAALGKPRSVWDAAAALGLPVVVTIMTDQLEELAATVPTLPSVPIALDHCGFVDWAGGVPPALSALKEYSNVHLKVSTIVLDQMAQHGDPRDGVAALADSFGASRLMWGSDYSQTHDRPYGELAEYARRAATKLGDDDRHALLAGTACRVWPELAR